MKHFIIVLLVPFVVLAQSFSDDPNVNVMRRQGQLVSVELVIGEPLKIFVVGREEAKIDLSDLILTVRRLKPYPGKVLRLDKTNNYFTVSEPLDAKKPLDLEVTTKVKGKSETLHFNIGTPLR